MYSLFLCSSLREYAITWLKVPSSRCSLLISNLQGPGQRDSSSRASQGPASVPSQPYLIFPGPWPYPLASNFL